MTTSTLASKRPYTRTRECPSCRKGVEYWNTSGMSDCAPHFYCGRCSNVIWRRSDWDYVARMGKSAEVAAALVATLPQCGCGSHFVADSGPKCPHCAFLFPNPNPVAERLQDPYAILVAGAVFYSENVANQSTDPTLASGTPGAEHQPRHP